ncbi:MAG: hypothetical protein KIS85_03050 [Anaerolineales bacterium]|nr:hypothetical protein [Anaerolineales bacterium]
MRLDSARIKAAGEHIGNWLRRDRGAIFAYLLATAAMSYPLLFSLGGNLMPVGGDAFMKLWDVWWLERLVTTGQPFYYTQDLFYPMGLDLSFHPTSWTVTAATWFLAQWIGIFSAYKVMIVIAIFSSAYCAYLLALWLTKNRLAAWFGGAIYSFSPYHFADLRGHPDLAHLAFIPLAVLCLLVGLRQRRLWMALIAGVLLGLVAWTGLYLFGFAVITLGVLLLYECLVERGWRRKYFWQFSVLFVSVAALLLLPRLAPVFDDRADLSFVIENKFAAYETQADLLSYFVPPPANSLLTPFFGQWSSKFAESVAVYPSPYLGWVALLACLSALFLRKDRKAIWLWAALAALFLVLSLGPSLRLAGRVYPQVPLPAELLISNVQIFRSVRPILFHIGLLLPLGMLASFGLKGWFQRLNSKPQISAVVVLLSAVLFAEYWIGPFGLSPLETSPIYQQIAEDQNEFAIIDLPMGYSPSKYYLLLQTIHGRPIVEGMSSRMPPNAFDYIDSNLLLGLWRAEEPLDCTDFRMRDMAQAINALRADGFAYILLHDPELFTDYFQGVPVTAEDQSVKVYSLADLGDFFPCINR